MTVNKDPETGRPIEVFLRLGKAGGCASATAESTGRMVSRLLQLGDTAESAIKQVKGVSCHASSKDIPSCVGAVALVLEEQLK